MSGISSQDPISPVSYIAQQREGSKVKAHILDQRNSTKTLLKLPSGLFYFADEKPGQQPGSLDFSQKLPFVSPLLSNGLLHWLKDVCDMVLDRLVRAVRGRLGRYEICPMVPGRRSGLAPILKKQKKKKRKQAYMYIYPPLVI